jgi:hypothetical protein
MLHEWKKRVSVKVICGVFIDWKKKLLIPDIVVLDYARPVLNNICSGVG